MSVFYCDGFKKSPGKERGAVYIYIRVLLDKIDLRRRILISSSSICIRSALLANWCEDSPDEAHFSSGVIVYCHVNCQGKLTEAGRWKYFYITGNATGL